MSYPDNYYFLDEDKEDYGLEHSEESNSEKDVDLESQYYNSKALKEDEALAALQSFQKVLDLENGSKGEWGFKALKQMIKIHFKLLNYKEMMHQYKQLLTNIKSAATRNQSEKSINSILAYISKSKNMELLVNFYETALDALKEAKSDRLWFKTNAKLGKLYLDRNDFTKLQEILEQLHQSCQADEGGDDLQKGAQILEIHALEMQMYTVQKNDERFCMRNHFKLYISYSTTIDSGRHSWLLESDTNPFASQEAQSYKNDPDILTMINLVVSYQNNDINELSVEDLLKNIRTRALIKLIGINTRIAIPFIANELNIEPLEVESFLESVILDSTIQGRIDRVNQVLELDMESIGAAQIGDLSNQLNSLHLPIVDNTP